MGDYCPGYDIIAETATGLKRISVKGLPAGNGKRAAWWEFADGTYGTLAVVRINVTSLKRQAHSRLWLRQRAPSTLVRELDL